MSRRKTITFDKENFDNIQRWRAEMLIYASLDFNFTNAVNHLLSERLRRIKWKTKR